MRPAFAGLNAAHRGTFPHVPRSRTRPPLGIRAGLLPWAPWVPPGGAPRPCGVALGPNGAESHRHLGAFAGAGDDAASDLGAKVGDLGAKGGADTDDGRGRICYGRLGGRGGGRHRAELPRGDPVDDADTGRWPRCASGRWPSTAALEASRCARGCWGQRAGPRQCASAAVCLRGSGEDRGGAIFAGFWAFLVADGFRALSLAWPGHGRAGGKPMAAAARSAGLDGEVLLAVLKAFGAPGVSVVAEGGAAGAFFRAFVKEPKAFGAHHVLLTPVTTPPDGLGEALLRPGRVRRAAAARRRLGPDAHAVQHGQLRRHVRALPAVPGARGGDRVRAAGGPQLDHVAAGQPEDWLVGKHVKNAKSGQRECRGPAYYLLLPSPQCAAENHL